jgi:hypothetical protein
MTEPFGSRRMVFADEVFYIHGPPTYLLPVHVANQRLLADRIFFYGRLLFLQDGNSEGFFTASFQVSDFACQVYFRLCSR